MTARIDALKFFPVKGLSGQNLSHVQLTAGQGFPSDRRFGFARPNSGFDPADPKPLVKTKFYMLARDAKLALLDTVFEDSTGVLSITAPQQSGQFDITGDEGKLKASEFLKTYLELPDSETPQLYEASPHRFTDVSVVSREMMNAVSIINLDSVREFSRSIDLEVDPNRFRGNIQLSGLTPFSELDMIDQELLIGKTRLRIVKRTKRCPATEVDLNTGIRDIKTPKLLLKNYGHMDMGIYAEVVQGGAISLGDTVEFV
ncbi:MAG: MOSC domain-containing protein [Granulosicoccus sp.]|nr:MOSC domain-containing protein [Granulosicoccus sp.]